jgi:polysaccharide pyruvyl transferase WcaK-like protein
MLRKIKECDAIMINGEGDYIFTNPSRRNALFYTFLLFAGQKFNKKTFLINAMVSECPKSGINHEVLETAMKVWERCDLISVRDPASKSFLTSNGYEGTVSYIPDALFTWFNDISDFKERVSGPLRQYEPFGFETLTGGTPFNFDEKYICVSGSSQAAWNQSKAVESYTKLVRELKLLGLKILIVPTCSGDAFLKKVSAVTDTAILDEHVPVRLGGAILAKASTFVSGRFHPSVLASLGGTPCVFLGSNSHKTNSLQTMMEYEDVKEYSAMPDDRDVNSILKDTKFKLSLDRELISNVARQRSIEAGDITKHLLEHL